MIFDVPSVRSHALKLFNYAFNEKFLNPSIYFSIIYTTLWSFPLMNSRLIFTPPCLTLALASNIYTLLRSSLSPRFHFFQSHTTITYATTHHTRTLYFFHIWYLNAVTTFETNPYPRQYHLQIHFVTSPR